jgi:glycosyltransferase involved in cell wall biosynthesis
MTLILPALNEAESIGQVIQAIPGDLEAEILVVDGGSQDETVSIARAAGARVIVEPRRGYGWACAAGAEAAQGELLVFMDADGADDAQSLEALTSPIQNDTADLVLGSRLRTVLQRGAMPWHQLAGNWLSARLIHWLYRLAISDLSPFRAVTRSGLRDLKMAEMTYGWPTEMIVKASRAGWRVQEIAVPHHPRLGGRSKISGTVRGTVLATYHILSTIFKYVRWEVA